MAVSTDPRSGSTSRDAAPEEASHDSIHVVGFSGSVSVGAAAIKSPVFEIAGRYFSGDPDAPPPKSHTYDRDQIEEYRERGLVSLISEDRRQPRSPGHVYIYAQALFIRPSEAACDLSSELFPLQWDERLGAHCAYMDRKHALALLEHWGRVLLSYAEEKLYESSFEAARDAAMRARFGATLEHPELLKKAHCFVAAARLGLGEDIRGVIQHAAVDFSREEADRVERRAHELFRRVRREPARREWRFTKQFANRGEAALAAW